MLASRDGDGTLRIWNVQTGQVIHAIFVSRSVYDSYGSAVAFSPTLGIVATEDRDQIKLYDVQTGNLLRVLTGHVSEVTSLRFSPDGTKLTSASHDYSARVWDVFSGEELRYLGNHTQPVSSVAFHPNGTTVATGSWDDKVRIWDGTTGALIRTIADNFVNVECLAFSPNGALLAGGLSNGVLKAWNWSTGSVQMSVVAHPAGVSSVRFTADNLIASAAGASNSNGEGRIKIWTTNGSLTRNILAHSGWDIYGLDFAPSASMIASGSQDHSIKLWNSQTGTFVKMLEGLPKDAVRTHYSSAGNAVAFSFDSRWNPSTGTYEGWFYLNATATGDRSLGIMTPGGSGRTAVSRDESWMATATGSTILIYDLSTGSLEKTIPTSGLQQSLVFGPDGSWLASAQETTLRIWDVTTGTQLRSVGTFVSIGEMVLTPDGTGVTITGGNPKTYRVSDLSLTKTYAASGSNGQTNSVRYSADGLSLYAGAYGGVLRRWNTATTTLDWVASPHSDSIRAIAISNDGRHVVSGGHDLTLAFSDASTGEVLRRLEGGVGVVYHLAYAPDDSAIAVAGPISGVAANPLYEGPSTLTVRSVTPSSTTRNSSARLRIVGSGFAPQCQVTLERDGHANQPSLNQPTYHSHFSLSATFDLSAVATGQWDVVVRNPDGRVARLTQALNVLTGNGTPQIYGNIVVPPRMRTGRFNTVTVNWANLGTGDAAAPILLLEALDEFDRTINLPIRTKPSEAWSRGSVMLVGGGNSSGSFLGPGEYGSTTVQFQAPLGSGRIHWKLSKVNSLDPGVYANNWQTLKDLLQPLEVEPLSWNRAWSAFTNQIGTNDDSFFSYLRSSSDASRSRGEQATSAGDLIATALANATGEIMPGFALETVTDISHPTRGLSLTFGRVASNMMISRSWASDLGKAWKHNYDVWAEIIEGGRVAIHTPDGRSRLFAEDYHGDFAASPGDSGTLRHGGIFGQGDRFVLTEANGMKFRFNWNNQLTKIEDTSGNGLSLSYLDSAVRRVQSVVHSDGSQLTFEYFGGLPGKLKKVMGPAGKSVTFSYGSDGHLSAATLDDGRATTYLYADTANFGPTKITYPDGRTREIAYDDKGRPTTLALNNGALPSTFTFGPFGEVTVNHPQGTSQITRGFHGLAVSSTTPGGRETKTLYDTFLNQTSISSQTYNYSNVGDERNNLLESVDAMGRARGASFGLPFNRMSFFRDAKGHSLRFTYDSAGQPSQITHPDNSTEGYSYTSWGAVRTYRNRRGQTTTYSYNDKGQVTQVARPDETLGYGYDSRGNMTSATSSLAGSISYAYNDKDQMTSASYPDGTVFSYGYDQVGRRTSRSGGGVNLGYLYDSVGRLERVNADGSLLVRYEYDSQGRMRKEVKGNGLSTTVSYDSESRVTSLLHEWGLGQSQTISYGNYDVLGNPQTMTTAAGSWGLTYDKSGQLRIINPPGGVSSTAVYDAEGNRITVDEGSNRQEYNHNSINATTERIFRTNGSEVNRETFTYDEDGNMLTRTDVSGVTSYTWNSAGQLIRIIQPDGDVYEYRYDALGNRVSAIKNGVVTKFVYDGSHVVAELDQDNELIARYLYGAGLVGRQDDSTMGYYAFDATGHTRLMVASNGNVLNSYEPLPFGGYLSKQETVPNRFGYVGRHGVLEDETGLKQMGARYYDSGLGRFVSQDRLGLAGGLPNLYSYVGNSVVRLVDSQGSYPNKWGFDVGPAVPVSPEVQAAMRTRAELAKVHGALTATNELLDPAYRIGTKYVIPALAIALSLRALPYAGTYGALAVGYLAFVNSADLFINSTDLAVNLMNSSSGKSQMTLSEELGCHIPGFAYYRTLLTFNGWISFLELLQTYLDGQLLDEKVTECSNSYDPNEKVGPIGAGAQRFVTPEGDFVYSISFENLASPPGGPPRADAQVIVVTDQLDSDLDISTMELLDVAVGSQTLAHFTGYQEGTVRIPRTGTSLLMDVSAQFDIETRTIRWEFRAIDPLTGELPDFDGILPPNDGNTGKGEGYVKFRIRPKANLSNGTVIQNSAGITFDENDVIVTNTWSNTIGTAVIDSKVLPLPTSSPYRFTVTWTGTETGGPGIASYDIFASKDGAPYYVWQDNTTALSAEFVGAGGSTYRFYSVATDLNGQVEAAPFTPDAITTTGVMTAYVESFTATQGAIIGGGLAELLASDDQYLNAFPDEASYTTTVELTGRFYGTPTLPAKLKFTIEAAVGARGLSQVVQLYNYTTNTWEYVDQRNAPGTDTTIVYAKGLSGLRYLSSNGTVRARIRCEIINDEDPSADGWVSRIDFVKWELIPVRN